MMSQSQKPQLKNVDIDLIQVDDRKRKAFGDIEQLAGEIKRNGLIQPIAVRTKSDGTYQLLAGERRLRACHFNQDKTIPIRIYPEDTSPLQVKEIELSENYFRKDFEVSEEAELIYDIHTVKVAIHGQKVSTAKDAEGWSMTDTAKFLGMSQPWVSRTIALHKAIQIEPSIGEAKTKNEALRVFKSKARQVTTENKATKIRAQVASTPLDIRKKKLIDSFMIGDAVEMIQKTPSNSVNLVEIDPSYAVDIKEKKRKVDTSDQKLQNYNELSREQFLHDIPIVISNAYRILTMGGWLICWFGPEPWFEDVFQMILAAEFRCRRIPGIWIKGGGQTMQPEIYMPSGYEMFFYASKGNTRLNKYRVTNTFDYRPVNPATKIHPTERPIGLMNDLLFTFVGEGSKACVPYLGSGNTLLSLNNNLCEGFGWDLVQSYKDSYTVRVEENEIG